MEHFRVFIEAQSLLKKIAQHRDHIEEHQKRIQFVEKNREKRKEIKEENQQQVISMGKDISSLEKELFSKEKDLSRANENLHKVTSESQVKALENEIHKLTPLIEELQEEILEKLGRCEEIESEISKAEQFLEGSQVTLVELEEEVSLDIEKEEAKIKNYSQRIDFLLEGLESNNRESFLQTQKSAKDGQVIAFLNNRKCSRCRFEASSSQVAEVENARNIEFCQSCSRILIPSTINS